MLFSAVSPREQNTKQSVPFMEDTNVFGVKSFLANPTDLKDKYILETYKVVLSLLVLGVIGAVIESRFSKSTEARQKEVIRYEAALESFQSISSRLAQFRAMAYRFVVSKNTANANVSYENYSDVYLQFVGGKVAFIHAMSKLDIGSNDDMALFSQLNISTIELDKCITDHFNSNLECELDTEFSKYVDLSTSFEDRVLILLNIEK